MTIETVEKVDYTDKSVYYPTRNTESKTVTYEIGGKTYNDPQLVIPDVSYSNLSVTGVSRLGIGETTDTGVGLLLDLQVSAM